MVFLSINPKYNHQLVLVKNGKSVIILLIQGLIELCFLSDLENLCKFIGGLRICCVNYLVDDFYNSAQI